MSGSGTGKKGIGQEKSGSVQRSNGSTAPPVYRPAPPQTPQARGARPAGAPPVYRPQLMQKTPVVSKAKSGTTPPVYRPQNRPKTLQRRTGMSQSIQRSLSSLPVSLVASFFEDEERGTLEEALGFAIPGLGDLEEVEDYVPGPLIAMDTRARPITVLKRRDWNPPAIGTRNVIIPGKMFYRFGDGPLVPLTAAMLNAHWDAKYGAPFVRVRGPEWRSNCGDYATGTEGHSVGDVADVVNWLNTKPKTDVKDKSGEEVAAIFSTLADGTYVFRFAYHFVRIVLSGAQVKISQKDGDSGVYSADRSRSQAAEYVAARNEVTGAALYKI